MQILVLGAGPQLRTDNGYPAFLNEMDDGRMLLEHILDGLSSEAVQRIVFAFQREDVRRYRLDSVVRRLTPVGHIVEIPGLTQGAACTALMAVDALDLDQELLLASTNEIVDIDLVEVLQGFRHQGMAAGVLTFRAVHPRYSYVALDQQGRVRQVAQCNPISQHATAGMFWFAQARLFVQAAQAMIRKNASHEGQFFVAPVLNELVLAGHPVGHRALQAGQYKPLKSPRQMAVFE